MDRRAIAVSGIVQGVGFRPYVYGLARRLRLAGFIRNRNGGVQIEVEGEPESLDQFLDELTTRPPPLARISAVRWSSRPLRGDPLFQIEPSETGATGPIFIAPDVATCEACLAELFDPKDRRYRYPFLNCTNCGPRLTIVTGAPYDRERTTMTAFALCPECRAEYEDPGDRRFHAQPTACPACGPHLAALDAEGRPLATDDPLAYAVSALRRGQIGALKGLGGYHLACSARDERAVAELRKRKHRDEKPFAVMVGDLEAARALCAISPAEEALLLAPRRPTVLLRQRHETCLPEPIAPRNPCLGVMLPYSPLHHLLLRELEGAPLVMTSGNRSDEPIAYEDHDAMGRLTGVADFFLVHDRPIHLRCDDSVTRIVAGAESPIRRSRGDAPRPIALPVECRRPTLALGGQQKATFALGRGFDAFLSHHIGDLDHYEAFRAYGAAVAHYERLFAIRPEGIVHDLHPDYASTRYAREYADGRPTLSVQHHHAHMASCMAEHGLNEPVIGVAFDGTGFGTDGTVWGGEFLIGDYLAFRRAAHLRPVAMPGGEQAIREPWRMAAAYLIDAGLGLSLLADRVSAPALATIERMIAGRINAPLTTSAGRLFDGVAALAGVRERVSYEGQAAMELEWLASDVAADGTYPFELTDPRSFPLSPRERVPEGRVRANQPQIEPAGHPPSPGRCAATLSRGERGEERRHDGEPLQVDMRPTVADVADEARRGVAPAVIGRRFHSTVVEMIAQVCMRLRQETGLNVVVLSGGVFLNALLTAEVVSRLADDGFRAYRHRLVPPNDGGLCLGQLAVAAAQEMTGGVADVPGDSGESG